MNVRKFVDIFYDPTLKNWNTNIERELKRRVLDRGKVTVVCRPINSFKKKSSNGPTRNYQSGLNPKTQSSRISYKTKIGNEPRRCKT